MSYEEGKIGDESGEWFERYVQSIFRYAGFRTERRKRFFHTVKHEIDVWAESEFAIVAVECKDWSNLRPENIKSQMDGFIHKVRVLNASAGVFAINLPGREVYGRHREYLKENGLTLWDGTDVQKWHEDMERYSQDRYQRELCDALGIEIYAQTNAEKSFKVLKAFGKAALKGAVQVGKSMLEEEKPRKRRRTARSRRY
ncbi:MAG: restriction endonuclease [Nitrososphaera sp.]